MIYVVRQELVHIFSFDLPRSTCRRLKSIGRAADGVVNGVVKLAAFCMVTAVAFGGEGVEAQAVTKGSQ